VGRVGAPTIEGPGLQLAWSLAQCHGAVVDDDADGLDDGCELAVASAFAPLLVVHPAGCNWDAGAVPPRLGGGYLFAVGRDGDGIRIAYLPAYFRDCGWSGAKCLQSRASAGG
jgi:hypothetical protein